MKSQNMTDEGRLYQYRYCGIVIQFLPMLFQCCEIDPAMWTVLLRKKTLKSNTIIKSHFSGISAHWCYVNDNQLINKNLFSKLLSGVAQCHQPPPLTHPHDDQWLQLNTTWLRSQSRATCAQCTRLYIYVFISTFTDEHSCITSHIITVKLWIHDTTTQIGIYIQFVSVCSIPWDHTSFVFLSLSSRAFQQNVIHALSVIV